MASRPARTITSILGIAVGIAAVLSVLIVDHNTILTEVLRRPSLSGRPDVEIRPLEAATPRPGVPEALQREADLLEVLPVFFSRIRALPAGGAAAGARDLELVAVHPQAGARFAAWRLAAGESLSSSGAGEALLPLGLAAELGLGVGDALLLQRVLPAIRECREGVLVARAEEIQGEVETFRVAGLIEEADLGRRGAVLVPFERGLELYRGAHVQPLYWARLAPDAIYQDVREKLKSAYAVERPQGALVGERVDQRAFRKSIRIAACLSLLLGLFIIYNAFSLSLVERVREIGLQSALGFTGREIAAAVLFEGMLLAAAGAALGLFLSLALAHFMRAVGITTLGFGKPLSIHEIPWDAVLIILGAGMAAALLGVVAPLLRVRRLSVIEAVRAGRIAYRPDPTRFVRALVLALLPGGLLLLYLAASPPLGERQDQVLRIIAWMAFWLTLTFGVVLLVPRLVQAAVEAILHLLLLPWPLQRPIAAASTRGAHHRVFGSAVGIALVLAAVLAIYGITASLKDETRRFAARALGGRIFVQTAAVLKDEVAPAARAPGVADFYSLSAEAHAQYPIRGVAPEHAIRWAPQLAADPDLAREFREGKSVILSEFLARSYGYQVGDFVRLSTFANAYPARVAAITDALGYFPDDRSFALLALPVFKSLFCLDDERGAQYVFHVAEGCDPDETRAAIIGLLEPRLLARVRTAQEIQRYYAADMNRDFWIFHVILVLTGALAFVGLWNSLTVALLERRREIGLLRTLGFTAGQIGGMLAAESAALGVVGGGLALAAGLPVSRHLVEAIQVISRLDVRYVATPLEIALVPLCAVFLALLATAPPAMRVRALVVASATRME
ncbi:MAG: ABC transporter permease [Planctomycetes bacterium]|nr:ABC transporter permease [Planctomycetota bacterium]